MRLKTYWHSIKNLLTSPEYYVEIFKAPFGFSFRFFIISMFLMGLSLSWKTNQRIIPSFQKQVESSLDEAVLNYPAELEVIWDENQLKSSSNEAIEIPYPELMEKNSQLPSTFGYFAPDDLSPEEFSEKLSGESLFVITNNKFFINDLQGVWADASLTDLFPAETIILNKDTSPELVSRLKQELGNILEDIKQLNFILIPIGLIIFRIWMSFFEAILIFFFFKLNKFNFSFKKTLQFSLHLMVVAEIINQIAGWIYPAMQISMLTLSYWCVFAYIFWTQKKRLLKL